MKYLKILFLILFCSNYTHSIDLPSNLASLEINLTLLNNQLPEEVFAPELNELKNAMTILINLLSQEESVDNFAKQYGYDQFIKPKFKAIENVYASLEPSKQEELKKQITELLQETFLKLKLLLFQDEKITDDINKNLAVDVLDTFMRLCEKLVISNS